MGWPKRTSRSTFGPTYENSEKIANPKQELDATVINALMWQSSGGLLTAAKALFICTVTGTTVATVYQGLAWDPNGTLPTIVPTRSGTGVYTWTLASSYGDETGTLQATGILGIDVRPMGTGNVLGIGDVNTNGYQGTINFYTANTGVAVDPAKFYFKLF